MDEKYRINCDETLDLALKVRKWELWSHKNEEEYRHVFYYGKLDEFEFRLEEDVGTKYGKCQTISIAYKNNWCRYPNNNQMNPIQKQKLSALIDFVDKPQKKIDEQELLSTYLEENKKVSKMREKIKKLLRE